MKVYLTITENCNIRCKHCFGDFNIGAEYSLEKIEEIVLQLKRMGVCEISITGGEPLLHNDITKIIDLVVTNGFNLQICTNGLLITENFINKIKQYSSCFFRFSISIDGIEKEHDYLRGQGTFNKIMNNIRILKENSFMFAVNTVLHKQNINSLEEFLDLLNSMDIKSCSFNFIRNFGRTHDSDLEIIGDELELAKYCVQKKLLNFSKKETMSFYFNYNTITNGEIFKSENQLFDFLELSRCGAGSIIMTIKANGEVLPCVFINEYYSKAKIKLDSLYSNTLCEIWNGKIFSIVRALEVNRYCKSCKEYGNGCTGRCIGEELLNQNKEFRCISYKSM